MGSRLGQHFLTDKITLKKMVELLNIDKNDTVIEIGPGHGELTDELRIKNEELRIIAIEKDEKLVQFLRQKFVADKNIEIIHGDALKTLPSLIRNPNYKVIGNIPYYITGYLLRTLGELDNKPSLIVLTTQREVAERICAEPPQMNLLSASIQVWAEPKIEMIIKRGLFSPPPKVDSAVIRLVVKEPTIEGEIYYPFIKTLFKQPRKTILNNLVSGTDLNKNEIAARLAKAGIDPNARPQNLTVNKIKNLSNELYTKK